MKTLQNNFTTAEQSKRLLELGVPADSADCYYVSYKDSEDCEISIRTKGDTGNAFFKVVSYVPCWSVGRLLEIYVIVRGLDISYLPIERGEDMVKYLIRLYEEKAKDMDFSKLEE